MDGENIMPVETPEALEAATKVLAKPIARWTGNENQIDTAIPGLGLHRWESPTEPTSYTVNASICLIAQGAKRVLLEEPFTVQSRIQPVIWRPTFTGHQELTSGGHRLKRRWVSQWIIMTIQYLIRRKNTM